MIQSLNTYDTITTIFENFIKCLSEENEYLKGYDIEKARTLLPLKEDLSRHYIDNLKIISEQENFLSALPVEKKLTLKELMNQLKILMKENMGLIEEMIVFNKKMVTILINSNKYLTDLPYNNIGHQAKEYSLGATAHFQKKV